jgi:hypothetical protein
MEAMKITAHRSDGKGFGAGEKVKEGFLFYGVYMGGTGKFIDEGVKNTFPVLPYPANPSFIGCDNTVLPAEKTVDFIVRTFLVKGGFFHDHLSKDNYQITISNNQRRYLSVSDLLPFASCDLVIGHSFHI